MFFISENVNSTTPFMNEEVVPISTILGISEFCRGLPVKQNKTPLHCRKHKVCRKFLHGSTTATNHANTLSLVLNIHDEAILGVVPGPDIIVFDFDEQQAWRRFRQNLGIDPTEHLIVETRRGVHLWLKVSQPVDIDLLMRQKKTDIRHNYNGYVIAPWQIRANSRYEVKGGKMWGDPANGDDIVSRLIKQKVHYLKRRDEQVARHCVIQEDSITGTEKLEIVKSYGQLRLDSESGRKAVAEIASHAYTRRTPSSSADNTNSAVLQSMVWTLAWRNCSEREMLNNIAFLSMLPGFEKIKGMDTHNAKRYVSRSYQKWRNALNSQVAYAREGWEGKKAPESLEKVQEFDKKNKSRNYAQTFKILVNECNQRGTASIPIGGIWLSEQLGVSHRVAKKHIDVLRQLGVIVLSKKGVPKRNRSGTSQVSVYLVPEISKNHGLGEPNEGSFETTN